MRDQDQLTVNLSKQTTSVTLLRDPGKTLEYLLATDEEWVSWPKLQEAGIPNPTEAVRVLQEYGAVIDILYKDTVTSKWEIHEDAPHHRYLGWHIEAKQRGVEAVLTDQQNQCFAGRNAGVTRA